MGKGLRGEEKEDASPPTGTCMHTHNMYRNELVMMKVKGIVNEQNQNVNIMNCPKL